MYILICIDDTDNIESRGTGELAENIASAIERFSWGKTHPVTRHQLLIHEDIPYTSHNSSMCFGVEIEEKYLQDVIGYAANYLQHESEKEADPGLCVVVVDHLEDKKKLIDFGYKAKKEVLTKENAYGLAKELNIHLSEHGGTGQGVIGALAGVGLRLSGNDGKFKGSHKVNTSKGVIKVSDICSHDNIDKVRSLDGRYLEVDEIIMLEGKVKTVMIEGQSVLLVDEISMESQGAKWKNCSKQQIKKYEEMKLNVVH
jgi:hypothetical protein